MMAHKKRVGMEVSIAVSHAVQLAVNERDQPVERALVAVAPDLKQTGDVPVRRPLVRRHSAWALSFDRGSVPRP